MRITIAMPCLNEEQALTVLIDQIPFAELMKAGYEAELLIVDGGSEDQSMNVARRKGATVLSSERGYGKQYRLAFEHASGEIIVTSDSDASYPIEKIPAILETLVHGGYDFVSLNRFADISPGAMRVLNRIGNVILTVVTNLLFKLNIRYSQSGMWAIRKDALAKLNLTSEGWSFAQEIKIEAFLKLKALEIPGSYRQRLGKSKLRRFRDAWHNLFFLFKKRCRRLPNTKSPDNLQTR